ncbi:MAG: hypothetical protein ACRER5_05180 [Pseudomonas sp.]
MTTILVAATVVIAAFALGFGMWTLLHSPNESLSRQKRIDPD